MTKLLMTGSILALALVCTVVPEAVAQSRCADCHYVQPDTPWPEHLSDWDNSAHARNNVGCEACHGGDATTFESLMAHRTVLNSGNPNSPTNRQNLPRTCGVCHAGPFTAFQDSQHFALLQKGDRRVPVCSTCHGAVGFNRPSARSLERQCADCHGPRGVAPRVERAEAARTIYEVLKESRELLQDARPIIAKVNDKGRRAELEEAYGQADVPLTQAIHAGHQFVYDTLKERLSVARQRIEALFTALANPEPRASR